MSSKCTFLTDQLYQYMLDHSLRPNHILEELFNYNLTLPAGQMQTSLEQTQFMQLLIKLIGAKKTIEVGVFTGLSTLAVALALPEEGEIIACDINEEWTTIAKLYWQKAGVLEKIQLKLGSANITLQSLLDSNQAETFDFAYIDADKASYSQYYELCLKLIKQNGLILLDNTFMSGKVLNDDKKDNVGAGIRKVNDLIFKDERVDLSILPLGDGLTVVRKR